MKISFLITKLIAVFITAILQSETANTGTQIIKVLVFGCLFALQLLIETINQGKYVKWGKVCGIVALGVAFYLNPLYSFPIIVVVEMEIVDHFVKGTIFYEMQMVILLLLWFIYKPSLIIILFTVTLCIMICLLRIANQKRDALWEQNLIEKEKRLQAEGKLMEMREYVKTVEAGAIMEERNRFAARIHDQLGHSISSSIILIEATALSLTKDPEGARQNLQIVSDNLRKGVDDIRGALRQERPQRGTIGTNEIKKTLEQFQITYRIETLLTTEGDLNKLSMPVWICIKDNLGEVLTNVLKHSNATSIQVNIAQYNKAVRVEYKDNGACDCEIHPGMGLSTMEERTAACGGTLLYSSSIDGFRIVTIFNT